MDFLIKHKKTYLMIGGTFFPAFVGYSLAGALGLSQNVKNIVAVAGLIAGGIITSKMLK